MNKKILALAVGSALALPMVAQAKVIVYGHAQVEIGNIDTGATDLNFSRDQSRGRFGIKASEKLGNGMTAYAKFEFATDTSDGDRGTGPLSAREHAVGLKGAFGAIELGRLKGPYKYFGGVTYDPFVATNLEARGNGGQTGGSFGHNSFLSNSIAWKSNNFNGLSVWLLASIDEETDNGPTDGNFSIGVRYKAGPFEVGVAAVNQDASNLQRTKLFGQYKWGNHKFSASFESSENVSGSDTGTFGTSDADTLFLGYQLRSGNNTFAAQYGNTDPDSGIETDYFAIGMIHHLSKKTRVFGGYRSTDRDTGVEDEVISVGLRVLF